MFVDWWIYLGPWKWLFIAIVCGIGAFWNELVTEPLAKRRFRKMISKWSVLELKAQLEERKRDNS